MDIKLFSPKRKSSMQLSKVYFWTDTIKDWKPLLKQDKYKQIIIDSWKDLVDKHLIAVYGFVIMPNHLHVIWELKRKNGREMPHASFNKATGHLIIKDLKTNHSQVLSHFKVTENERSYRVWQRDPMAVLLDNKSILEQKLNYIHLNPLQKHWNLVSRPEEYYWSSANFYETGHDPFSFLTHYMDRM